MVQKRYALQNSDAMAFTQTQNPKGFRAPSGLEDLEELGTRHFCDALGIVAELDAKRLDSRLKAFMLSALQKCP